MATKVIVPQKGLFDESCIIQAWKKKEGDRIEKGEIIFEVETNKAVFDRLASPIAVLGSRNWITPSAELEEIFFPQKEWIIDMVHERILPLPGHEVSTRQGIKEINRRNRLGV